MQTILAAFKHFLPQSTDTALVRHMKTRRLTRMAAYTTLTGMAIYAVCFICPPVHDDYSHAITGTSVASDTTLSIAIANDTLALDLTPTSRSGTFASTTTPATIYVTTNNITGYTLGIRTSNTADTATRLVNTAEECDATPTSTKCSLSSLDTAVSQEDYEASTATDLNNTWGYMPSKYNSVDNTDYLPAPGSTTTPGTLDILDVTDAPSETDTTTGDLIPTEYTINLGSRIDYTPYAGEYSGTLVVTAVGNPVPYSVSYDANKPEQAPATADVDNMPTAQAGTVSSGDTVAVLLSQKVPTLGNNNPSTGQYDYAGYVFTGWCNTEPTEDSTTGYQTCPVQQENVTLYQPGDTYGIDQTVDNTQVLYAVWGAPATITFDGNGLIYNSTATDVSNTVEYIPTYSDNKITGQKSNIVYTGTYLEPAPVDPSDNYIFKGWSTDSAASEATYVDEQAIINNLNLNANDNITLYAIWAYATVITFNKNGADGTETMEPQVIEAGATARIEQNTYTNTGLALDGWDTDSNGIGNFYAKQADFLAPVGQSADITLYAQWGTPCNANSICYLPNGANEGASDPKMAAQTTNYSDNTNPITSNMAVNLWPSNYKYDTTSDGYNDYGFVGWSADKNAATKMLDSAPTNNSTIYGPNQNITLGDVSTEGLNLYAIWAPVAKDSTDTDLTFQTANFLTTTLADGTTLASKPNGYVTTLKDQRDNQAYAVAKLADGNYWMIENLRLDNNATLDSTNTNNPASGFSALTASSDSWCTQVYQSSCVNQNKLNTSNVTDATTEMTSPSNNIYSYGNYYNWYSATAGNGTYDTSQNATVAGDICPTGWHLPYGGDQDGAQEGQNKGNTSGGFYYLNEQMGGDTSSQGSKIWRSFPNNFVYSGRWDGSYAASRSYGSYYWSSTSKYGAKAYHLVFWYNSIYPGTDNHTNIYGFPVRCVASQRSE